MHVGRTFDGTLAVSGGASFTVDGGVLHATAVIGRDAGGTGEMLVTQDSAFNIIGQDPRLFVGRNGTATLQILDASTVHIEGLPTGTDSGVQISSDPDGDGQVGNANVFVGAQSSLSVSGNSAFINVGTDGHGTLRLQDSSVAITGLAGSSTLNIGQSEAASGEMFVTEASEVTLSGENACQSAPNFDPGSASNIDPSVR